MYLSTSSTTQTGSNADMLQLGNFAFQEQRYEDAFHWYSQAASQGSSNGQYHLAQMYSKGQGTDKNEARAMRWMRSAAKQGLPKAEHAYASMLEFGRGMEQAKPKEAVEWYKKAAQHGHPNAILKLANLYFNGEHIEHNAGLALQWVLKAEQAQSNKTEAVSLKHKVTKHITNNANKGNRDDQYLIAMMNLNGRGIPINKNKAMYWLNKSATQGNADAQYELGKILSLDNKSWQKGKHWLTQAALRGHIQAGYALAALLSNKGDQAKNSQTSWRWLYHGLRNNDAKTYYNLAISLHQGLLGLPKDDSHFAPWLRQAAVFGITFAQNDFAAYQLSSSNKAKNSIQWLTKAAQKNDIKAQFNLGLVYARGLGVTPNDNKAIHWLSQAKENNNAKAEMMLGVYYALGRGAGRDEKQAAYWYEAAANDGEPDAAYNLALLYMNGQGVEQDYSKSAYYLKQLAEQGDTNAQNLYASLFLDGKGVKFSPPKAAFWFKRAASSGHIQAMFNLATLYRGGSGIVQNDKKAVYWYKKAAEKGYAPAQNAMGYMYAEGRGVKQDESIAEDWFYQASDNGLTLANNNLDVLKKQGTFTLVTLQVEKTPRTGILTDKNIDVSAWLEVHHQPVL
jgi:TPR repeat protein